MRNLTTYLVMVFAMLACTTSKLATENYHAQLIEKKSNDVVVVSVTITAGNNSDDIPKQAINKALNDAWFNGFNGKESKSLPFINAKNPSETNNPSYFEEFKEKEELVEFIRVLSLNTNVISKKTKQHTFLLEINSSRIRQDLIFNKIQPLNF